MWHRLAFRLRLAVPSRAFASQQQQQPPLSKITSSLVPITEKLKVQPKKFLDRFQPLVASVKDKIGLGAVADNKSAPDKIAPPNQNLEEHFRKRTEYNDDNNKSLDEYASPSQAPNNQPIILDTKAKYWYQKLSVKGKIHREKLYDKVIDYIDNTGQGNSRARAETKTEGVIMREIRKILKEILHRIFVIIFKIVAVYELGKLVPKLFEREMVKRYKRNLARGQQQNGI